jgi:hypothetical protein
LPDVNKGREFVARQSGCGVVATYIPVNRMATGLRLQDNAKKLHWRGKENSSLEIWRGSIKDTSLVVVE